MSTRDYAYEALAEVSSTDQNLGRGQLNAALRDIRAQEPALASIENSYLLGAEIHDRAKLYRQVFDDAALTPNALAKHWKRVKEEAAKKKRGGTNLHVGESKPLPPRRQENLDHAREILGMINSQIQPTPLVAHESDPTPNQEPVQAASTKTQLSPGQ